MPDATEKKPETARFVNKAKQNGVFIAVVIFICLGVVGTFMSMRDSAMIHEYRINRMEADLTEIKKDVKSLLAREVLAQGE